MQWARKKSRFRRSFLARECIIRRKAALIREIPGDGDISHGKSFAAIAAGCFVCDELRAGVERSRKENGNAGEGLECEPDAGPLRRLDARRPSGYRDAVLDLQAESGGAPDVAVGPREIQRGQIVLRSARISHRG